jgi:hypothetical protein
MPIAQTVASLSPAPTIAPNTAAGEVRAAPHQAPALGFPFPPPKLYSFTQQALLLSQSPDLPRQTVWGFGDGFHAGSPGPTYVAHYGVPQLGIPGESGHPFRRESGHHSDVKAATHSETKAATIPT